MFCANCGTAVKEGASFCASCGAPTVKTTAVTADEPVIKAQEINAPVSEPALDNAPKADGASAIEATAVDPAWATAIQDAPQPAFRPTAPEVMPQPGFQPAPPEVAFQSEHQTMTPEFVPQPAAQYMQTGQFVQSQGMYTQMPDTGYQVPPLSEKKPKKSKKPLIITLAIVVFLIIATVSVFAYITITTQNNYEAAQEMMTNQDWQAAYDAFDKLGDYEDSVANKELAQQWLDYEAAVATFEAKDYEAAKSAFEALGEFEDSADYVVQCQDNIDFNAAVATYDAGDYEEALAEFERLDARGFEEAADWPTKCEYAMAEELFDDGDVYGAYRAFKALGTYEDSAERAEACKTPLPATGVIYHGDAYKSTRARIVIDATNSLFPCYFKVYSGDTLACSFFVNPGEKIEIDFAPGQYTMKQAVGFNWFGEEIMFGDEGAYKVLTFDNDSEVYNLGDNIISTIVIAAGSDFGGNAIGSNDSTRDEF